ncbi:helix-turn-helix transcriptional regulator [Candidatus Roizmanbacteria bacterium]|nr:helix-turn-helix transcriptional regulator [Candidatus Roizmanbacteria bacterium]
MKKVSNCHVDKTLSIIGGKWKLVILWHLANSMLRFSELERRIEGVTQKMLAQSLRELEKDKLITRKVYPVVPPKVEYSITRRGVSLGKVLQELDNWGRNIRGLLKEQLLTLVLHLVLLLL